MEKKKKKPIDNPTKSQPKTPPLDDHNLTNPKMGYVISFQSPLDHQLFTSFCTKWISIEM